MTVNRIRHNADAVLDQVETRNRIWNSDTLEWEVQTTADPAGIKIYDEVTDTYKGLQFNAEAPQVCAQDYLQALAEGDIAGHTGFSKWGVVTGVNDTTVDMWDYGATTPAYVFPASAAKCRVKGATQDDDDITGTPGTGARKIKINGLIANYSEVTEEVTMNGTADVETTNSFLRINKLWISSVGTSGVAAGMIQVYHLTNATPIYATIQAGNTMSRQCIYTVPLGKTLYIVKERVSSGAGGNAVKLNFCAFTLRATVDPGTGAKSTIWYPMAEIGILNQAFEVSHAMPLKIPATADVKMSVKGDYASGASKCTASLRGWLE